MVDYAPREAILTIEDAPRDASASAGLGPVALDAPATSERAPMALEARA